MLQQVFNNFRRISQIPRGTFNTKDISNFLVDFAKGQRLKCFQDLANNVIIKKAGTGRYQNAAPVILQGHMDMVCQKEELSTHDFMHDPIEIYEQDGYLSAKGTTLGADNGIAIAYIMTLLESGLIEHPPIEALITTDEETGMNGARQVDMSLLHSELLINLDYEEEGVFLTDCAGAFSAAFMIPLQKEQVKGVSITISLHGLAGGHSGLDIYRQRGNALKLLGRLLLELRERTDFALVSITGGAAENAICAAAETQIAVRPVDVDQVLFLVDGAYQAWKMEFAPDETDMIMVYDVHEPCEITALDAPTRNRILYVLGCVPDGVLCYSRQNRNVPETSINMGKVLIHDGSLTIILLARSPIESKKTALKQMLKEQARVAGIAVSIQNDYPGWKYRVDSRLRDLCAETYWKCFNKAPVFTGVHAGLECGLLMDKKPGLDCISFGPTILDAHTARERLDIASAGRTWGFLLKLLQACGSLSQSE